MFWRQKSWICSDLSADLTIVATTVYSGNGIPNTGYGKASNNIIKRLEKLITASTQRLHTKHHSSPSFCLFELRIDTVQHFCQSYSNLSKLGWILNYSQDFLVNFRWLLVNSLHGIKLIKLLIDISNLKIWASVLIKWRQWNTWSVQTENKYIRNTINNPVFKIYVYIIYI